MGGIFRQHLRSVLALLAVGVLAAGCGRDGGSLGPEVDEPLYREGMQLVKEGRPQEALSDYLKLITQRGDLAPESHLNAGLIYLEDVKDPIAAIYHFRRYLELAPNSPQAINVRGLIDTAKRDFARTLPGDPLATAVTDAGLSAQLDQLRRENGELRAALVGARGGASYPVSSGGSGPPPMFVPSAVAAPVAVEAPPPSEAPAAVPVAEPEPAAPVRQPLARPAAPPGAGRRYTVAPRDTLFGIAKRFYGTATNARVQAIIDANRGVLSSARDLRPGMQLRIP